MIGEPIGGFFGYYPLSACPQMSAFLTPEQYGAAGDYDPNAHTGTDDSTAFSDMFDDVRAGVVNNQGNPFFSSKAVALRPGAFYRIDTPINMTGIRSRSFHLYGNGATLFSVGLNNKPIIDMVWTRGARIRDLRLFAENGAQSGTMVQPNYGIVMGRKNAQDGSENVLDNVSIQGWFNKSCLLNIGGELCQFNKCTIEQSVASVSDISGLAVHLDPDNEAGYSSDYQTISGLSPYGMNENLFIQCNLASVQSGNVVRIVGKTAGMKFINSYAHVHNSAAVRVKGTHKDLELDLHVEDMSATAILEIDKATNALLTGLSIKEHGNMVPHILKTVNSGGTVKIVNGRIAVSEDLTAGAKVFASSDISFTGEIRLPSGTMTLS